MAMTIQKFKIQKFTSPAEGPGLLAGPGRAGPGREIRAVGGSEDAGGLVLGDALLDEGPPGLVLGDALYWAMRRCAPR
jgi:hypothetical protein